MKKINPVHFIISLLAAVVLVMGAAAVPLHAAELPEGTRLPVIYVNTDTRANLIGKKEYTRIEMKLEGTGYDEAQLYSGTAYLRLRGNSTAGLTKKPYKLKLETKADLLGMGASKHWVLLANAIDLTNLRNHMLQTLAGRLGLDYMESQLVSLVYNGTYMGVYELCEQVRVGKTRVDIYDWEDLAADAADAVVRKYIADGALRESDYDNKIETVEETLKADFAWVSDPQHAVVFDCLGGDTVRLGDCFDFGDVPEATGGVLMEMDFYAGGNADLRTAYKLPIYMSSPSYKETRFEALENYMKEYVQSMEYAMHATDFTFRNADIHSANSNEGRYDWRSGKRTGTKYKAVKFTSDIYENRHYTDFVDLDSVINNMILCEVSDNWDCMKNSFFMYKDIDSKIKFGPAWDFDWAWGNSMYNIDTAGSAGNSNFKYARKWQTTNDWFANEQYYQTQQFNRLLIRDPYFVVKLYERYHEVREVILALPAQFDELTALYGTDSAANYERWRATDSCGGLAGKTYKEQKTYTGNFIKERVEWLDAQFESVETLMKSLNGYYTDDGIAITAIDTAGEGFTTVTAEVTEPKAAAVSFQVNGKYFAEADVVNGTATVQIPDEAVAGESGKLSVIQARAVNSDGTYVKNTLGTESGVYVNAVSNYATFTKVVEVKAKEEKAEEEKTSDDRTEDETGDGNSGQNGSPLAAVALLLGFAAVGAIVIVIFKKKQNVRE